MGGYGSTRWNWERTRTDDGGLLQLDIRRLARDGCLAPGAISTITWTRGDGEPAGTITTYMDRDRPCLTLDYATQRQGETEWTPHLTRVWLDATPCHYGGERPWFQCPGCGKRRAVLYSVAGVFACRACHDLAYASTREDSHERSIRRVHAIQNRLGGGGYGVPIWDIPPRPARMQWQTYRCLVHELRWELHRQDGMFDHWLAKREALLDRLAKR
jgi:hypothetical protein